MILIVVVAAMLIFFMFSNKKKQKARAEQMKNDLVPGASVMTSSGIYGTVVSVDEADNKVTIESGPGTILVFHKQAIGQVQAAQADPAPAEPASDEPAESAADSESPRITDAELDAMNAAKRESPEQDSDSQQGKDSADKDKD
ncbi:preprotein translocase subunit YajC [Brevibacterium sp. 91QC2O2]|uniref:preprotein translocase subunit YajC n=1 Tax=Brevibacterium TaxID=1696 RepID=UPI00211C12E9|nr:MULTISPECIES: preprotein translocase subunit YajC [unclassified Brevibacterium]MCQ9366911.1 preprotein translocase subunit YajC [Brevibacterium sp. 91QC2O2]MCQ9384061.1 preprotein translocase subunit YajC [Brevibacterium sp. 68QC2CO]